MENHVIRPVLETELDVLHSLAIATFCETFTQHNTQENMDRYIAENVSREKVGSEFGNPDSRFYFSLNGNTPSGYLKLNVGAAQTEFKDSQDTEIERIYVLIKYQRLGIGAQLLKYAAKQADAAGSVNVWLGVWEQNIKAISFYEKYGFRPVGKHSFFVGEDEQTDILMRTDVSSLLNTFISAGK